MVHVLVTGTFDGLHPGHRFLFRRAKALGDRLTVVVARDKTVYKVKGRHADHNETTRRDQVAEVSHVNKAILGWPGKDKLAIVIRLRPDIIALGYDQRAFTQNLRRQLRVRGLPTKVVRLPAYQPRRYKSGLIRLRRERQALHAQKRHGSFSKH
jgi:FAD synthetase